MISYGKPISGPRPGDAALRLKTRMLNRRGKDALRLFAGLRRLPPAACAYSRASRHVLGPYLHAVKIEINTACDLHCRMCYVRTRTTELPGDVIRDLLRQLKGSGTRVELLGGEPLLRRDCAEIVSFARNACGLPFVSLYTNATRATPQIAAELQQAGLSAAIVSLISPDGPVHDRFTGSPGSFDATLAGIEAFRAAGVPVYTFTAVHRENAGAIPALYRKVKQELGVHALFYPYIPQLADDPLMLADCDRWYAIKRSVLYEYAPQHRDFVTDFVMLTGGACSGGNFVLTVKADGTVQPCPFVSDIPLGSVREQSLWEIYRHRFRSAELSAFKRLPAECEPCSYASVCGGGCRAGNRTLLGSYARRDVRCRGPYRDPIDSRRVMDRIPCFF